MAINFLDCQSNALFHRDQLNLALEEENEKNILYNRGKYIYFLKQLHKIDPYARIATGDGSTIPVEQEISAQLQTHQEFIKSAIRQNKNTDNVTISSISKEIGLKIRRLSTRASQVDFSSGRARRVKVVTDALGLAKSIAKLPIMISSKVLSKIGPLAVTVLSFPFALIASTVEFGLDVTDEKKKLGTYDDTVVHQMSDALKVAVKTAFEATYKTIGRL